MQVDARYSSLLFTDPPLASIKNHKKMLEEMFEKFGFAKLLMQPQAVLALFSQGAHSQPRAGALRATITRASP